MDGSSFPMLVASNPPLSLGDVNVLLVGIAVGSPLGMEEVFTLPWKRLWDTAIYANYASSGSG